jgi:hypothetical protein
MQTRASAINSIPTNTTRQLGQLKAIQDNTTAQLASDTTALLGNGDPDHITFLTPRFKGVQMIQAGGNAGIYGTLAAQPDQHASLETPYYKMGTPFPIDRAGSGNFGFNVVKSGTPPDGYYGGDKVMVQSRYKIYYGGDENDPANHHFIYKIELRAEPKGYELQPGERLDGNIFQYPKPTGWTFPTDSEGNYLYNTNPDAWTGEVSSVVYNPATLPVIDEISPNFFQLPDTRLPADYNIITITGQHFSGSSTAIIGPYSPAVFSAGGSPGYGLVVDDSTMQINAPEGMVPGVYDIYIIGGDGQIGVKQNSFTVLAAVG